MWRQLGYMEYIDYLDRNTREIYDGYDGFFHICTKAEYVCEYHKKTIFQCRNSVFLPARYVENNTDVSIFYDLDGVESLERYIHRQETKTIDILKMIKALIHTLREAECFLVTADEIDVCTEKLFIDVNNKSVKLIYVPGQSKEKNQFTRILEMIKAITSDEHISLEIRTGLSNYYALIVSGCRNIDDIEKMTKQYISASEMSDDVKGKGIDNKSVCDIEKKSDAKQKYKGASDIKTKGAREYVKDAFIRLIT